MSETVPANQLIIDWCCKEIPGFPVDTHTIDMVAVGQLTTVLAYQPDGFTKHMVQKSMGEVTGEIARLSCDRLVTAILAGLEGASSNSKKKQQLQAVRPTEYEQGLIDGFSAAIDTITNVFGE